MVLAALLTGLAWWLSHQRTPRTHEATHATMTEPAPFLVWGAPPVTSRDATTISDAPITSGDAGASTEARDRLGALLVAQICARRDECQCGTYPSPYAEGHETATTCEADAMRDFLRWWGDDDGANILRDEAELARQVSASVGCSGTRARFSLFFERRQSTGASEGEACDEQACRRDLHCVRGRCAPFPSADDSCDPRVGCAERFDCVARRCVSERRLGESCGGPREAHCEEPFECVEGRCEVEGLQCKRGTLRRRLEGGPYDVRAPSECIPVGTSCSSSSDCGWADCEGAGAWICGEPGAHADVFPPWDEDHGEPRCASRGDCDHCNCPTGESCRPFLGGRAHCVHVGERGESCEGTYRCADGLACEYRVPAGGRCMATLCAQTTFFPRPQE